MRLQVLVAASRLVTTQIQADLVRQILLGTFQRQPLGFQPLLDLLDIRVLAAKTSGTKYTHDIAESWRTRTHVTTVRYNQAKTSLNTFDLESCAVRPSSPHEPTVSYSSHPLASPRRMISPLLLSRRVVAFENAGRSHYAQKNLFDSSSLLHPGFLLSSTPSELTLHSNRIRAVIML